MGQAAAHKDDNISFLMTMDELTFADEPDCIDLFDGKDKRERIMIFRLEGM